MAKFDPKAFAKKMKPHYVKPSEVKFTNPVTGKTETVLDSSAMDTKLTNIKGKQVKDLRTRSGVLVDKITEMESQIKSPAFKDKHALIQNNLNTAYSELEQISVKLGEPYQRPSGDASPDTGSDWYNPFTWFQGGEAQETGLNERQWKNEFNRKLASGEVKQDSSKASWTQNKYVDYMYQQELKKRKNEPPLDQQTVPTLIENSEK